MVFIKPDIEAGTIQDQADLVTQARYPEPDTDEEPDVEEIEVMLCRENVNSTIPPIKLIYFKGKLRRKHK